MPRFDLAHHPLLPLLSSPGLKICEDNNTVIQKLAVSVSVKMIQDNRFKSPAISSSCLKYLHACLMKPFVESFSLVSKELLSTLLDIVTLTDDKFIKNPAISLLQLIITNPEIDTKLIYEKLNNFLASNLAFNSERVFQSLTVLSAMNRIPILDILPGIEAEVAKIEKKKLRKLLENLKSRLGNKTV